MTSDLFKRTYENIANTLITTNNEVVKVLNTEGCGAVGGGGAVVGGVGGVGGGGAVVGGDAIGGGGGAVVGGGGAVVGGGGAVVGGEGGGSGAVGGFFSSIRNGCTIFGYKLGFYTLLILILLICVCAYFVYKYFKSKRNIVNIVKKNDNIISNTVKIDSVPVNVKEEVKKINIVMDVKKANDPVIVPATVPVPVPMDGKKVPENSKKASENGKKASEKEGDITSISTSTSSDSSSSSKISTYK